MSMSGHRIRRMGANIKVPDVPGTPFGGGYYAGKINVGGAIYAIIVAPRPGSEDPDFAWKTENTSTPNTSSRNDGWANTMAMVPDLSMHPAAQYCLTRDYGGFTDWYLPAYDELDIIYRVFKPTVHPNNTSYGENPNAIPPTGNYTSIVPSKTTIPEFAEGGAHAFAILPYKSSSQGNSANNYIKHFQSGLVAYQSKTIPAYVRPVRRIKIG